MTTKRRVRKGRDLAGGVDPQNQVDAWNARFPIGTGIRFWEVVPFGPVFDGRMRSAAFVSDSGHPAVFLNGKRGYVLLDHCVPWKELHPECEPPAPRFCRECNCTEDDACDGGDGYGCRWVADDLCSSCITEES